jgi:hypothetical protein
MLGRDLYIALVSQCYSLKAVNKLAKAKPASAPIRVVKEVEDHFRTLPATVEEFNHYTPSVYLMQHSADFESHVDFEACLSRFEHLFEEVNKLL